MEISVNQIKKTVRLGDVEDGSVFRYRDTSDYWIATDEISAGVRQCVRLRDGIHDCLSTSAEVVVVNAKLEVTE